MTSLSNAYQFLKRIARLLWAGRPHPGEAPAPSAVGLFTQRYKKNRDVSLDVMRGIAVLMILAAHNPIPASLSGWLQPITVPAEGFGWTGPDMFFVLSGFLVAGLLFKELIKKDSLDVKRFIFRRGLKIWPSYYVYLAFAAICFLKAGRTTYDTWVGIAPNLIHIQNYVPFVMLLTFTWTLGVEEHFYLFLPLALALIVRLSRGRCDYRPWIVVMSVAIVIACPVLRYLDYLQNPNPHPFRLMATHLHVDGIALGVLLAYVYHYKPPVFKGLMRYRALFMLAMLALVGPFVVHKLTDSWFFYTFSTTMLSLGWGFLLVSLMYIEPGVGRLGKIIQLPPFQWIAFIGFYSFSIYLWHFTCREMPYQYLYLLNPWLPPTIVWLLQAILYVGVVIIVGYLAARSIELPVLALRDRLPSTRSSSEMENPVNQQTIAPETSTEIV